MTEYTELIDRANRLAAEKSVERLRAQKAELLAALKDLRDDMKDVEAADAAIAKEEQGI